MKKAPLTGGGLLRKLPIACKNLYVKNELQDQSSVLKHPLTIPLCGSFLTTSGEASGCFRPFPVERKYLQAAGDVSYKLDGIIYEPGQDERSAVIVLRQAHGST